MNNCFKIQLTDSINNPLLKRADEFAIPLKKGGNGSDFLQIQFAIGTVTAIRIASGNGMLYTTGGVSYNSTELTDFYGSGIRVTLTDDDILYLKGQSKVSALNFRLVNSTDNTNSPQVNLDFKNLKYITELKTLDTYAIATPDSYIGLLEELNNNKKLETLQLSYCGLQGDISKLSLPALTSLSVINSYLSGDANNIRNNCPNLKELSLRVLTYTGLTFDIKNAAGLTIFRETSLTDRSIITYTGSRTLNFTGLSILTMQNNKLATDQLDNLLIALSVSDLANSAVISLTGTRSADSDAAMTALANKGVTVTINT